MTMMIAIMIMMMMMTMTTTETTMMMTNLCSGKMKSCAFVFVHTPHICMALTIVFHDKDHGDHDVYDHPANHDDCDSHDVLDHHGYHDDLEQYFSNIK